MVKMGLISALAISRGLTQKCGSFSFGSILPGETRAVRLKLEVTKRTFAVRIDKDPRTHCKAPLAFAAIGNRYKPPWEYTRSQAGGFGRKGSF
ncbi:hypothetical protein F4861DRAFT_381761 [Xylaria intraflava]|nr:hypothetical protein F4861DRAFT_381761 [Xylaria intraflava]